MNKKSYSFIGLAIGLIIAVIVYFLIKSPRKSTIDPDEIQFAVKDTASIQKVILTGYIEGNVVGKVYLTKKNEQWWVNDKFKAQNITIENLLQTIYAIQMQQPLHPNAIENVKKLIKKRNVHVIIQNGDGTTLKGYYIGPATPDTKGNYVILEGAENPYIAEIPGFNGYLSTRFSANPEAWRDYTIWNLKPDAFQSFELKDKAQNTLIRVFKNKDTYFINNQPFKDSVIINKIQNTYLRCTAAGTAQSSFPNAKDSLSKVPADFYLLVNQQDYLLWRNPFGAFFIAPVRQQNQSTRLEGEILLLQKMTVQKWLFDKIEKPL